MRTVRFHGVLNSMLHLTPSRTFMFLSLLCFLAGCGQTWTKHLGGTFEFHSPTVSVDDLPSVGRVRIDHRDLEYTISKASAHLDKPGSVLVGFTVQVSSQVQRREIERLVVDTVLSDLNVHDAVVLSFD